MSGRDHYRDQRVADEVSRDAVTDRARMCSAHGCPCAWTVDPGRLCRWHADAPSHRWPEVTDDLQATVALRAQRAAEPKVAPRRVSLEEKRETLRRLRTVAADMAKRDPKAWARALQAREQAGQRLTLVQRQAWRTALGVAAAQRVEDQELPL